MSMDGLTVEEHVDFKDTGGATAGRTRPVYDGRTPRISRMVALALRIETLVREGVVTDYADVARLGHVTRARVTQIMNLLHLAPDIQEELLFLPRVMVGRDPIQERTVRPIAAIADWRKQRRMWSQIVRAMRDCLCLSESAESGADVLRRSCMCRKDS